MVAHLPGTRALKVLEAACRHLNFSRAAAELGLTPAAVSHQVREFEEQLGVRLFHRTSRVAVLTPAGEIMHSAIREALDRLMHAQADVQRSQQAGRLRISTVETIASKWLLPRIGTFMRLHPEIDIALDISNHIRDFLRDNIDVAFRWGPGDNAGVRIDRLFDHCIFPVCSPRLLAEMEPPKTPRDLLNHKLIHIFWSEKGVVWPGWREWFEAAGIEGPDVRPGMHFTETGHAVQAAIDGHGIALGDSHVVCGDLEAGRLVRLFDLSIGGPPGFSYHIATPLRTADTEMVRLFRDWVLAEARQTMETVNAQAAAIRSGR